MANDATGINVMLLVTGDAFTHVDNPESPARRFQGFPHVPMASLAGQLAGHNMPVMGKIDMHRISI